MSPPKTQDLVLIGSAFVALRFESRDWRSWILGQYPAAPCSPGPFLFPEGPTIKNIQSRSKFSISIEIFNLARKFQSRRLDLFPPKIGPRWVACLKISFLLEISNCLIFGPSGLLLKHTQNCLTNMRHIAVAIVCCLFAALFWKGDRPFSRIGALSFFSLVFSKIPRKTSNTPRIVLTLRTLKNPAE